ncbi:MAG: tRNA epoxyqueuosine(34) reductase QueG [Bacteroidetes bacterium]|nr:MAG: tRNA epoxyqueuosine(34) reductase QueG [Bacteroidota bacterium]TAG85455.1 MAG: tRNA epoxyqueuosine(34) reductase QueG [Bacteroidota bacterium]
MLNIEKNTKIIKETAKNLGFDYCGISKADFLEEEANNLENWLKNQYQGEMKYMENHFDKRLNPTLLVDNAKSVVSLLFNYFPQKDLNDQKDNQYKISKYAYGEDYHEVIKKKLKDFLLIIQQNIGEVNGRAFVDSAPVMDKVWAKKSGLGWQGKHTNLINRKIGSFFFIAELIIDLPLIADGKVGDFCGTCTKCIDACPTDAIFAPYQLDASKCISYFTIELKKEMPENIKGSFENWIFGCDICQDVCPWNRFSSPHQTPEFFPSPTLLNMSNQDWQEITEEVFKTIFKNSPIKRAKLEGLKRNIAYVEKEKQTNGK